MLSLNTVGVRTAALRLTDAGPSQPQLNVITKRFRRKSICDTNYAHVEKKPCFDIRNISIVRGNEKNAKMISSFLHTQYWPREPTVAALWMPLDSQYLQFLTDKFSHTGERFLAVEKEARTGEQKMVGLAVANRVYPWMIAEYQQWGHCTDCVPDRHRMYFCAHCLQSPDLFRKYKVDYIYDVEALGTSAEVAGQGVGTLLLNTVLASAKDMRRGLVQVIAVSSYASKICEKCGMEAEWSMEYRDFVDKCGQSVFFPRSPHRSVDVYVKYFDPNKGGAYPCKPAF